MASRYRKPEATEQVSEPKPLRMIIYCRISKAMDGEGEGVFSQETLCREHCDRRGHQVVAVFTEKDPETGETSSATDRKKKRRDYAIALRMIMDGEADGIVSYNLDRLTRTPLEIETLINMWGSHGLIVETLSGDLRLDTDDGRMFARMVAARARAEVERKSQRRLDMDLARAKRGKPSPWRAYGYDKAGQVIDEEAEIVRGVFDSFLADGKVLTIVKDLKRRRLMDGGPVLSTKNKPFNTVGIRHMLLNPRYIAERWMAYSDRPGSDLPSEQHFIGPGDWKPIVEVDVFRAVGEILENPDRRPKEGNARKHLGSGLYLCGICGDGTTMLTRTWVKSAATRKAGHFQQRVYACRANINHNRWAADPVDELVMATIVRYIAIADLASIGMNDEQAKRTAVLRRKESELEARRKALLESVARGVISDEDYAEIKTVINSDLAKITAEIKGQARHQVLGPLARSAKPVEFFLAGDVLARQQIIRAVCPDGIVLNRRPPRQMYDEAAVFIGLPAARVEAAS